MASATRPTSPLLYQSSSSRDIGLPQDNLDDLVNGLAEEYNHNSNNENGENVVDEGKAKNCNDRSNGSGDTDDDDARDGDSSNSDSSDSDKGNKAYGYTGRRRSLAPVGGRLEPKHAAKYHLQRSHLSPSIPSMHMSNKSTALSSDYYKRARSPIYNRLRARKPLLNLASNSDPSKAILGTVSNANLEEWLIQAALRRQEDGLYTLDILL